ncbi:MAG: sugar nucleotide-binding protein, partial [Sphingomicrobium sp.]
LLDEEKGIWHLTNQGAISWHDLAREVADRAKVDRKLVLAAENDLPLDTSLTSGRGILIRSLDGGLNDFFEHSEPLRLIA